MRWHARYQQMLAARRHLSADETRALDVHLSGCAECRSLAGEYDRQDAALSALVVPAPSPDMRTRVMQQADQPVSSPWRRRIVLPRVQSWFAPVLMASAIALIVVAALLHARLRQPAQTAGVPVHMLPAPQTGATRTAVTSHGIRLVLSVPAGPPRSLGSVIAARVSMTNVSRRTLYLFGYPSSCATSGDNPAILEENASGRVVYPPTPSALPSCPFPRLYPVHPRQILTRTIRVPLRSGGLRARLVMTVRPSGYVPEIDINTPILQVPLISGPVTAPPSTTSTAVTPAATTVPSTGLVTSESHGVRLSLRAPHGPPRPRSKITLTITVRNIGQEPIQYLPGCPIGGLNPGLVELNDAEHVVYSTTPKKPGFCPLEPSRVLRPGQQSRQPAVVPALSARLRARLVAYVRSRGVARQVIVQTPVLHVALPPGPEPSPTTTFSTPPRIPTVDPATLREAHDVVTGFSIALVHHKVSRVRSFLSRHYFTGCNQFLTRRTRYLRCLLDDSPVPVRYRIKDISPAAPGSKELMVDVFYYFRNGHYQRFELNLLPGPHGLWIDSGGIPGGSRTPSPGDV